MVGAHNGEHFPFTVKVLSKHDSPPGPWPRRGWSGEAGPPATATHLHPSGTSLPPNPTSHFVLLELCPQSLLCRSEPVSWGAAQSEMSELQDLLGRLEFWLMNYPFNSIGELALGQWRV